MKSSRHIQRGGTVVGIIIGVLLGLCAALAVAIYVTKVPVPFVNKPPVRSAQQDQEEARKNQGWDPNAPLQQNKPSNRAAAPVFPAPAASDPGKPDPVAKPPATNPAPPETADAKPAKPPKTAASAADPLGDLAKSKTEKPVTPAPPLAANTPAGSSEATIDPFTYFVQAGAFRSAEDAEAQKAKLGLMGLDAKVTEREQSGRTVWRVRIGPYQKKDDADKAKERLESAGVEVALVRVQR